MTNAPVRIALVGCGYISQAEHVPAMLAMLPAIELVATVDADIQRATAVGRPFGASAFHSLEEALAQSDFSAVLIATPATTHVDLIELAARAGKHVLVEKPVAYSISEAKRAVEIVLRAGVICMVAYHRRYDDDCRKVRSLLAGGAIGEPRAAVSLCRLAFPSVYSSYAPIAPSAASPTVIESQDFRSDWLIENSIHHLNLLRFWLGPVTKVHSAVYRERDHNLGMTTLSFGDILASHHQLRGMECGEEISLYGSRGALRLDLWYPHRPYAFPRLVLFDRENSSRSEIIGPRASPYTNELSTFLACLRGEAENDSTLADSLEDLVVLKSIQDIAVYTHAGAEG